jgi:hypothetical protein
MSYDDANRALANIRHTARQLPKSVGSYHRSALYEAADVLANEIDSLRAFKRSVDEALNTGDGSYRP